MGTKSSKCNTENAPDSKYLQGCAIPLLYSEDIPISPSVTLKIFKSAHQSLVRDGGLKGAFIQSKVEIFECLRFIYRAVLGN